MIINPCKVNSLKTSKKAIFDIFSNIKIFNNIKGIAVYVNNEIAGFAIGRKIKQQDGNSSL